MHWYSKKAYMTTYEHMIHHVPGFKFYESVGKGPIQPPVVQVKVGRPQKERRKDANEKDSTKVSRIGHKKTCSKCFGQGHNH